MDNEVRHEYLFYPVGNSLNDEIERLFHTPRRARPIRKTTNQNTAELDQGSGESRQEMTRSMPNDTAEASSGPQNSRTTMCVFCKRNGETVAFYSTHLLKEPTTGKVICPILRQHKCEICGETGDNAHTKSYCPAGKELDHAEVHNTVSLKMTPRNSDGKLRKHPA